MNAKTLQVLINKHKDKKVSCSYQYQDQKEPFFSTIAALDKLFKSEPFEMREIFFLNLLCNGYTTSPAGGRFTLVHQ